MFGALGVLVSILGVMFGVPGVLFGVLGVLSGSLGVLFGIPGVLVGVIGVCGIGMLYLLHLEFGMVHLFSSQKCFYSLNKLS